MLLGFAGHNKNGKKHELQSRALELVKIRSTPIQNKIRELHKATIEASSAMMGQGGQNLQYSADVLQMMGLASYAGQAQARNPYAQAAAYNPTAAAYASQQFQVDLGRHTFYIGGVIKVRQGPRISSFALVKTFSNHCQFAKSLTYGT